MVGGCFKEFFEVWCVYRVWMDYYGFRVKRRGLVQFQAQKLNNVGKLATGRRCLFIFNVGCLGKRQLGRGQLIFYVGVGIVWGSVSKLVFFYWWNQLVRVQEFYLKNGFRSGDGVEFQGSQLGLVFYVLYVWFWVRYLIFLRVLVGKWEYYGFFWRVVTI